VTISRNAAASGNARSIPIPLVTTRARHNPNAMGKKTIRVMRRRELA
jgi:hypothetical protein